MAPVTGRGLSPVKCLRHCKPTLRFHESSSHAACSSLFNGMNRQIFENVTKGAGLLQEVFFRHGDCACLSSLLLDLR